MCIKVWKNTHLEHQNSLPDGNIRYINEECKTNYIIGKCFQKSGLIDYKLRQQ